MKTLLLYISVFTAMIIAGCGGNDSAAEKQEGASGRQLTSIQWFDSLKNYGKINEGEKLAVSFRFKNSGDKPLIIESVKPTCGCTIADYPKEPIAPGAEGEITGEFDSNGREGLQHKELTVTSNIPGGQHNVIFEVTVIPRTGKNN